MSLPDKVEKIKQICTECGSKCCKPSLVPDIFWLDLMHGDLTRLCNMNLNGVVGVGFVENQEAFTLSAHIFGYCPFLDYKNSICKIYENRLLMCKTFPFDPRFLLKLKDYCLLLKKISQESLNSIHNSFLERESKPNYQFIKAKKWNEDIILFHSKIEPYLYDCTTKHSKGMVPTEFGTFDIQSDLSEDDLQLNKLFSLLQSYSNFFSLSHVVCNIRLLSEKGALQGRLFGVYAPGKWYNKTETQIIIDKIDMEFNTGKFDAELLQGVFYINDSSSQDEKFFWEEQ